MRLYNRVRNTVISERCGLERRRNDKNRERCAEVVRAHFWAKERYMNTYRANVKGNIAREQPRSTLLEPIEKVFKKT